MNNSEVTIYHKTTVNHGTEVWTRYNYSKSFFIGGKGANTNKGYENANDVSVRLYYKDIEDLNIENFAIGDIIVQGNITLDITSQTSLSNYLTYNITAIQDNTTGSDDVRHIHINGK